VAVRWTCPLKNTDQTLLHRLIARQIYDDLTHSLPLRLMLCRPTVIQHYHIPSTTVQLMRHLRLATGQCRTITWGCGRGYRCNSIWWMLVSLITAIVSITTMIWCFFDDDGNDDVKTKSWSEWLETWHISSPWHCVQSLLIFDLKGQGWGAQGPLACLFWTVAKPTINITYNYPHVTHSVVSSRATLLLDLAWICISAECTSFLAVSGDSDVTMAVIIDVKYEVCFYSVLTQFVLVDNFHKMKKSAQRDANTAHRL